MTAGTVLSNTATASSATGDPDPGNESGTATTTAGTAPVADLKIAKSHTGTFAQGLTGATFTITVTNGGTGPTSGLVTVADALPAGLLATAIGGTGWNCVLLGLTCTRSDALGAGASYPAIVLTVNVSPDASPSLVNTATVAGGGDGNTTNNTATDAVTIQATADLAITKSHVGSFAPGQVGAIYRITVGNVGTLPTSGPVTVIDGLPPGLTATAMAGSGWTCTLGTLTCTRGDALAAGASYPPIVLTVDVAAAAVGSLANIAIVSGGGDLNTANNSAVDVARVLTPTFEDVPATHPYRPWIEALVGAGVTGGCSLNPPLYCPDALVTRGQMAVFLLRVFHGQGYEPLSATLIFADVPLDHPFADWISQLSEERITVGCRSTPLEYCPNVSVTRAQMAVFLLRLRHGFNYEPPAATGTIFVDVAPTDPLAAWVEQLAREGISGGCAMSALRYCPGAGVTRAEMAVFLVRAFNLPL
jgi:uncharacterized repeat protein (TIGR01451 family)